MRIILARHGRLVWDFRTPISGRDFAEWHRGEDEAPLDVTHPPGSRLEQIVRAAGCVFTSTLRRSRESATLLAPAAAPVADAVFCEAELPGAFRSRLRFPPGLWGFVARSSWICGWSPGVESYGDARVRAAKGAALLRARAARDSEVVLVGHGFMNILIGHYLRAAAWRGPKIPSRRHWAFGIFTRDDR